MVYLPLTILLGRKPIVGVTVSGSWSLSPKSRVDLPALSRPSSKMVMFFSFLFFIHRKKLPASVNILPRCLSIQKRTLARRPQMRPHWLPRHAHGHKTTARPRTPSSSSGEAVRLPYRSLSPLSFRLFCVERQSLEVYELNLVFRNRSHELRPCQKHVGQTSRLALDDKWKGVGEGTKRAQTKQRAPLSIQTGPVAAPAAVTCRSDSGMPSWLKSFAARKKPKLEGLGGGGA